MYRGPLPRPEKIMAGTEKRLVDHVALHLERLGYEVSRERKVGRWRVDLLAEKDDSRLGIEVKADARGLLDDLNKCWQLLRSTDLDETYACAPTVLISEEDVSTAEELGVGLVGVGDNGLEWKVKSWRLDPPSLQLSSSHLPTVGPGRQGWINLSVNNGGQKPAFNVHASIVSAGPFLRINKRVSESAKSKLDPRETRTVELRYRTRKTARPGIYPLVIAVTASNATRRTKNVTVTIEEQAETAEG